MRLLAVLAMIALAPAHAADFRWTSGFGQGIASAAIRNQAGSSVEFACDQGGAHPGAASLAVLIRGKPIKNERLYQFVIDGKNHPVILDDGWLRNAQTRADRTALLSIAHSLVVSRAPSFSVEVPDVRLDERFSLLNVKDALGEAPGKTLADCKG